MNAFDRGVSLPQGEYQAMSSERKEIKVKRVMGAPYSNQNGSEINSAQLRQNLSPNIRKKDS